ncbi:CoB--CoM heterodisulfide reductase iron-sulfur subunit B family protein [Pseudodesulfovibrio indicus]|uniref:Heterodisulfide reductase subunit B n=1 Tax=Pseudodesulfovibrio indicus TaxID=1716143 RepID=A0A126QJ32_9BACT|nr:CoB--CoM heterodisulfide reductase iron-sulfur subunit B family protein [Pseudodesulfovibrio indicus]AMK09994.1 heterodisulfide reductase subunit B [Pseudodesulfovibrio indicus]TDT87041.1 heterodisulfide reductase subunit B [Pseudodesulfovibrio indicus]
MSRSLRFAYYPGCSGQGTSIEYDRSTRGICRALGIELVDIPDWSCCGSTPAHTVDHVLSAALSARNILQAESLKDVRGIITPCPSCLTNLKTAARRMRDADFKARVDSLLDAPCRNDLPVMSVLQVIYQELGPEAVKARVTSPLTGLKVAPYYGCIMNRPPEIMDFDDCENPIAMDRLMLAAGAEVMPFPLKVECCGASFGVARNEVVTRLSGKLLDAAACCGASAMVTACPLCQMNLDLRQGQINRANGSRHDLPIFYYTQLIGMALGLNGSDLMLDKLCVDPKTLLRHMRAAQSAAAS